MQEIADPILLRALVGDVRARGGTIGLVPTLGALHAGHLALANAARTENSLVVMSIFVNPTQFGAGEDFNRYPRNLPRDRSLAAEAGVDVLFVPSAETMYPDGPAGQLVWVDPGALAVHGEGAARPSHFRAVATVVAKLFHLVQPDRAYFGQKDGQQAAIVRQMVRDLLLPVEIRVIPTVREHDGLALSSRNVYLSPAERAAAPVLARALGVARAAVAAGEREAETLRRLVRETVDDEPPVDLEYAEVFDLAGLAPVTGTLPAESMVALAARVGGTRLIDNLVIRLQNGEPSFD